LGAGTIVLRTPTLADIAGVNTTRPSGINVQPLNLLVAGETNAQFEYAGIGPGSNIPTLEASPGQKTIFPEGKRADPWKPVAPIITFENPPTPIGLETNVGLYTIILDEVDGANITFPLGANEADSQVPVEPTGPTFVKPDAENKYELYIPIFPPLNKGDITTLPLGKRTPEPKSP
jgi:hypothetical protein